VNPGTVLLSLLLREGMIVYANGYGKGEGTHVSVFLCLLKGPYDDDLTWPLKGQFRVELLNQLSDKSHHSCTVMFDKDTNSKCINRIVEDDEACNGWGCHQFVSQGDIINKDKDYLREDTIYFRIISHDISSSSRSTEVAENTENQSWNNTGWIIGLGLVG